MSNTDNNCDNCNTNNDEYNECKKYNKECKKKCIKKYIEKYDEKICIKWLKGETGKTGPWGPEGPRGKPGKPGKTGNIGPMGPRNSSIVFASGPALSPITLFNVSSFDAFSIPIVMGFGNQILDTSFGTLTASPIPAGFTFPIPFDGLIRNLQVSSDMIFTAAFNPLQISLPFKYTIFKSSSSPNNGNIHPSNPFINTTLETNIILSGTIVFPPASSNASYTATNISRNSIPVFVGDRIGIRVQIDTNNFIPEDFLTISIIFANIQIMSFSASVEYKH